ncbi:MAG: DUF4097 family beta strand repeat-containing protein [Candidatus Latescibacterota bacterium]
MRRFVIMAALICLISGAVFSATGTYDEKWDLSGVSKIKLSGVSGDVIIWPADGTSGGVELRANVRPSDSFAPKVKQSSETLLLTEKFHGSSSGEVEWTIYLPKQREPFTISINTASGNLGCSNISADISFETPSGDIEMTEVNLAKGSRFNTASGDFILQDMTITDGCEFSTASGDFLLENLFIKENCGFSTASGDIRCSHCKCAADVDFSSASGDVIVRDSHLKGLGGFSSASGDVALYFDILPDHDLSASSASGDVRFSVEDFGDDFTLLLIKRKGKGGISCPFEYTSEETFKDHHVYEKKIVKRGSGHPEIELRTASGKVVVTD